MTDNAMTPNVSSLIVVTILLYCVPSTQPSLGPGKTIPYETECKNLRMGQFLCPDTDYNFIDPETQQLLGCTKDNVAQGFVIHIFYLFIFSHICFP